jgi:glucose/arabinose dehydrogenase
LIAQATKALNIILLERKSMTPQSALVAAFAVIMLGLATAGADLVIGGDPRVDPANFRITTFASGLNYPLGMAQLDDGSIMVAVSNGSGYFGSSSGRLLRLADDDDDGVADSETVLFDGVPGGGLSSLRIGGDLIFVCGFGEGRPISILRAGATPDAPLTLVGSIQIAYSGSWLHPHSALGVRDTPGQPGSYDLFFQLGSDENFETTTRTLELSSDIGLSGTLNGDAVHKVTITDHGDSVSGSDLIQIATGLRNPAGFAFHPASGDLYLQDNGIDGLVEAIEAHSADEINVIPAAEIGGAVEDFGFPDNYVAYRSGETIGGAGIAPLVAFLPLPDPQTGEESEGPADIAFAPPGFPPGLNRGLFVGFHGQFSRAGLDNEENPLVYVDLESGEYFHFVDNDQPNVGHLDGLLPTADALFVADISPQGGFGSSAANKGVIYQIRSLIPPTTAVEGIVASAIPTRFELAPAYPNPFNPQTTLRFAVPDLGRALPATLKIYNLVGQELVTLADEEVSAGAYEVGWDGRDASGNSLGSGVYLYRLKVGQYFAASRRMTLLK